MPPPPFRQHPAWIPNYPRHQNVLFPPKQNTSVEVIKSLPGDLWETFGASGWGPDGRHAFMEFDYGTAQWGTVGSARDSTAQQQQDGK